MSFYFKAQQLKLKEIQDISTNTADVQIDQLILVSYGTHAGINYFASLGIFVHQGRRMQR